ncbi:MAG: autotransporter domain-containing protein, partial [Thermoguttaceae bacterium]|nr:autotransporter domain-containing protein [Thermoguttaceae bacterium]
ESVFNIGKTGQDNSDIAEIMLTGGNATFDRGTVNLNGQGLILAEEGSTLTFTDVTVNNNSERNGYALSADTLVFSGNSIYNGGKTVRVDNMTFETGATLALGVNDNLTFDENGVLTLESGSILAVDFSDTENGMVTLTGNGTANFEEGSIIRVANASSLAEGDYTNRTLVTTETENNIFESTYEDTAFFSLTGTVEGTNLILNLNVKKNFADLGTTPNEVAVGEYIDSFRMDSENVSEDLQLLLDDVMAQKDAALVAQTLDSFSGVNRANSMMLAMNNPWQAPFHQLVFGNHKGRCCVMETGCPVCPGQQMQCDSACDAPCDDCGMGTSALFHSAERIPHNAWFTTRYTSFNANSDGNSEKYGISDTGLNLGYDWINCNDTKVGLVFGYAQPYLYSHSNRIHMSNFQLGVYGGHEFADGWETRVYFGFGIQEYTNKRTFNEAGHTERFRTVYDGNTLAGSFQLGRSFQVSPLSLFRPFVQFDSQQVWQQGANETGGAAALIYQSGDWNRTFVRGGIETEFNTMFLQFTSRF